MMEIIRLSKHHFVLETSMNFLNFVCILCTFYQQFKTYRKFSFYFLLGRNLCNKNFACVHLYLNSQRQTPDWWIHTAKRGCESWNVGEEGDAHGEEEADQEHWTSRWNNDEKIQWWLPGRNTQSESHLPAVAEVTELMLSWRLIEPRLSASRGMQEQLRKRPWVWGCLVWQPA